MTQVGSCHIAYAIETPPTLQVRNLINYINFTRFDDYVLDMLQQLVCRFTTRWTVCRHRIKLHVYDG